MATTTETITKTSSVETVLNFFVLPEDGSIPYNIAYDVPEGTKTRNFTTEEKEVRVTDVAGRENEFSLDKNGFQFEKRTHPVVDFSDEESIQRDYYPSVINAIKSTTGASKAVIFDHTLRQNKGSRNPVLLVHVDQTAESAATRVRLHCPDEAEELLKKRFQIINYWRPIAGPVEEFPLALGDATTTADGDLVSVEHRYRERTGATGAVKYNPNQKFYYKSAMDVDDGIFIKCYDSKENVAARTPHTAFKDPTSKPDAKPRRSIEVRTLVFYD